MAHKSISGVTLPLPDRWKRPTTSPSHRGALFFPIQKIFFSLSAEPRNPFHCFQATNPFSRVKRPALPVTCPHAKNKIIPLARAHCAPYAWRGLEGLCPRNAGEGQDGGAQKLKIAATRVSSFPVAEDGRGDRSSFPPPSTTPRCWRCSIAMRVALKHCLFWTDICFDCCCVIKFMPIYFVLT